MFLMKTTYSFLFATALSGFSGYTTVIASSGCCSVNHKTCINWCGNTKKSCHNCNHKDGVTWLANGAPKTDCQKRWNKCEHDENACCDGLVCRANKHNHMKCLPPKKRVTHSTENTIQPPAASTKNGSCCSLDFVTCINWCGSTKDSCLGCNHHDGVGWLQNGPPTDQCLRRWKGCQHNRNGCCDGLTCKKNENNWLACLPTGELFSDAGLFQTSSPSSSPSSHPSASPSSSPSESPSTSPSSVPSEQPSESPSESPSSHPSASPSSSPSESPSASPSSVPSEQPSESPSEQPSESPSESPSEQPSGSPSEQPSEQPSESPSESPSASPSESPSASPSESPSVSPSLSPSYSPSSQPTLSPTSKPCCSLDFKNCINWCGSTHKSCASCNHHDGLGWLKNGEPKDQCLSRWSGCGHNKNGCCDGLVCKKDPNNWLACLPKKTIGNKVNRQLRGQK